MSSDGHTQVNGCECNANLPSGMVAAQMDRGTKYRTRLIRETNMYCEDCVLLWGDHEHYPALEYGKCDVCDKQKWCLTNIGYVAQSGLAQRSHKAKVPGSSPGIPTKC